MVIQDPRDKRNVTGYYHLAVIYSETISALEQAIYQGRGHARKVQALRRLVDSINKYTSLKADMSDSYTFDSRELFKTPWILVNTYVTFRLTPSEAQNLGSTWAQVDLCSRMNFAQTVIAPETALCARCCGTP